MSKSPECSNLINKAKENYQRKMAEILQKPSYSPKTILVNTYELNRQTKFLILHVDIK